MIITTEMPSNLFDSKDTILQIGKILQIYSVQD